MNTTSPKPRRAGVAEGLAPQLNVDAPGPAPRPQKAPDPGSATIRALARYFLEDFARTRAPLMREPREAVMRALALAAVAAISARSRDQRLRLMAAATLERHLDVRPSKHGCSKQQWAAASALFADVMRLQAAGLAMQERQEFLAEILAGGDEREGLDRRLYWAPPATLLDTALRGPMGVNLRAARWILTRTRALARRVGYGKPAGADDSPSGEFVPPALPRAGASKAGGLPRPDLANAHARRPDPANEHARGCIGPGRAQAPP